MDGTKENLLITRSVFAQDQDVRAKFSLLTKM